MKRCSNCILTERTPKIQFNEKNICIYCKTHQKIEYKGEDKLLNILHKYRGSGKKIDCIVTLSGGRDSTFTLLKLVKETYEELLIDNIIITAIHGSLEPGIFRANYPDLDMITVGPTIDAMHSPDERLDIQSVEKFWKILIRILRKL